MTGNISVNRAKLTKLRDWLAESRSEIPEKSYCHLLLTERPEVRDLIINELAEYFYAAHEPARMLLRNLAQDSLHPLGSLSQPDSTSGYPEQLHPTTLQGYFGEVFAGIVSEHYELFGSSSWEVPAFLFHAHDVAFQQLELGRQTGERVKHVPGRPGDDCLAFERDGNGDILRVMFCEAKCTTNHDTGLIRDSFVKLSLPNICPVDLLRVVEALRQFPENKAIEGWISALRTLYFNQRMLEERCDLSSYVCGQRPIRKQTWISTSKPHSSHTAKRQLTSVEVHLDGVRELVSEVYSKLARSS